MHVRIVSLEGCDGTRSAIKLVQETALEMGISIEFEHVVIKTQDEARLFRHIGSPTVQINGKDIEPDARVIQRFGLT